MPLIDAKRYDFPHVIITLLSSCLTKPVHPFPFMCCLTVWDALTCCLNSHVGTELASDALSLSIQHAQFQQEETTKIHIRNLKKSYSKAMTVILVSISLKSREKAYTDCERRTFHYLF